MLTGQTQLMTYNLVFIHDGNIKLYNFYFFLFVHFFFFVSAITYVCWWLVRKARVRFAQNGAKNESWEDILY